MTKKVKIPTTKGKISAVINYSKVKTDKLAILCPGFLDNKDYLHLVKLSEELTKQNYTVIRFNPIGTWDSQGDISEYTLTQYLIDIRNVLEYMLNQGDYKKIILGGHSMGALAYMLYATQDPRISIVLSIMPGLSIKRSSNVAKIEKWEKLGYRISLRDIPNKLEKREFKIPYTCAIDNLQYNIFNEINKFHGTLILIASKSDSKIPIEDVEKYLTKQIIQKN